MIEILQDVSEPQNITKLAKSRNIPIKREFLEVGDYLLGNGIAIERKLGNDLINSIISGRIWEQISNLIQYEKPILAIITPNIWKDFYYSNSRYIHKSFFGAIATMTDRFGITVLMFQDDDDFVRYLGQLNKKINDKKTSTRPVPLMRKPKTKRERQENALAQCKGISIKTAKLILDHFKSLKKIVDATADEIALIPGIGKTKAKNIKEVFD